MSHSYQGVAAGLWLFRTLGASIHSCFLFNGVPCTSAFTYFSLAGRHRATRRQTSPSLRADLLFRAGLPVASDVRRKTFTCFKAFDSIIFFSIPVTLSDTRGLELALMGHMVPHCPLRVERGRKRGPFE